MSKPVNLRVVRNQRERAAQREMHRGIRDCSKRIREKMPDCDGWVLVAWDSKGNAIPYWDNRARCMPSNCIGEFVKRTMERCIGMDDAVDIFNGDTDGEGA